MDKQELKIGDRIDYRIGEIGDEWVIDYATIIYFKSDGNPVAEMNYPGHDGCRWAHEYSLDGVRKTGKK